MNPLRFKIIDSATKLFSEKGFYATSVQEIAEDCSIAKGMVYKFFESKEALFVEVHEICHRDMIEQAELIKKNEHLSGKEKLKQAIVFMLHYFLDKKYILLKVSIQENEDIARSKQRVSAWLFNWRKECLLEAYGDGIGDNIWDLVFIFRGVLREYQYLIIEENNYFLSIDEIAGYVIARLDSIVKDIVTNQPKPILKKSVVEEHYMKDFDFQFSNGQSSLEDIFDTLLMMIENVPASYREELQQSINLLREEIKQAAPRWFLIHALLALLEKEDNMVGLVKQISTYVRMVQRISSLEK